MQRLHFETSTGPQSGLAFGDPDTEISMVFAHANGMSARAYAPMMVQVAQDTGKRVFALDTRGHGESGLAPLTMKHAHWWSLAGDYLAALDALNLEKPKLSGHSLGANLSMIVSRIAPERVQSLHLFDPVLSPRWLHFMGLVPVLNQASRMHHMVRKANVRQTVFDSVTEARERWSKARIFQSWSEEFFDAYVAGALTPREDGKFGLNCPPQFEALCFRQLKLWPRSFVKKVACPTDILKGETGSMVSEGVAAFITRNCPNFTIRAIPNTSHFLPMQVPEIAAQLLIDALV